MSVVMLALLTITVVAAIAMQAVMFAKNKPFYGALSVFLMSGPGTVLAFLHLALQ